MPRSARRARLDAWSRRPLTGLRGSPADFARRLDWRLANPDVRYGAVAEGGIDTLDKLLGFVLHLDGARAADAQEQNCPRGPARFLGLLWTAPARPFQLVGHGKGSQIGTRIGRPIGEQLDRGKAETFKSRLHQLGEEMMQRFRLACARCKGSSRRESHWPGMASYRLAKLFSTG